MNLIINQIKALLGTIGSPEEDDLRDLTIDAIGELKRKNLRTNWRHGFKSSKQKAARRRAVVERARQTTTKLRRRERIPFMQQVWLLRKFRPSLVLDALYPQRESRWKLPPSRPSISTDAQQEIELRDFSFLDDPNATVGAFRKMAELEASERKAFLHFADDHCLDVTPYMLLSEFWHEMLPVFQGGGMKVPVQKVLVAVGLEEALRIMVGGVEDLKDVWAFPMMKRRSTGSTTSRTRHSDTQTREAVGDQFCAAMDTWLSQPEINRHLNAEGRGWIKTIIGEILENAERHSDGERRDGAWSIAGFMARRVDEESGGYSLKCHLGFVNMGDTFFESLERALPDTLAGVKAYVNRCRLQGCTISAETLWTLCAIQDGVTSVQDADLMDRGGYGLQEMIDMVSILGPSLRADWQPRITILSGSSCIMLREPYTRGVRADENAPRVLWFNGENSSELPPDPNHVFDLDYRLPGTIISVQFVLDPEFLGAIDD